jgi:hypothetical protein
MVRAIRPKSTKPIEVEELDKRLVGRHAASLKPTGDFRQLDRDYAARQAERELKPEFLPEEE